VTSFYLERPRVATMASAEGTAAAADEVPLIEMRGIEKRFGQVVALDGVDLRLESGEILALVGDNGSGKSTLIKTLVGFHQPDAGTIAIRGEEREIPSPKAARKHGISTVYQDLALVDTLSVATNMFLGRTPVTRLGFLPRVDWDRMNEEAEKILRTRLNIDIDATQEVEYLSGGERQAVAIGRARSSSSRRCRSPRCPGRTRSWAGRQSPRCPVWARWAR